MGKKYKTTYSFTTSEEERTCRLCNKKHKIGYVTFRNNTHHLVMVCSTKNRNVYIPFEPNLKIPSVLSKSARKHNQQLKEIKQGTLFSYLVGRDKRSPESLPEEVKPY